MRILIAPDAYKECMSARAAAEAMARGVGRAAASLTLGVEIDLCPLSDGGAGLVEQAAGLPGAERRVSRVTGPLGEPVEAAWALRAQGDGVTAVLEMSAAAGLALVPAYRRDPERTTTFGVGELLLAAMDAGATSILIGIGNSATCDAGAGACAALGARFVSDAGEIIRAPTGGDLGRIARVDTAGLDPRLRRCRIDIACDVDNPLFGPDGSARVFAAQKGATLDQIDRLDAGLRSFAARCAASGVTADTASPGMGAAGGLAFGLVGFCGGRTKRGAAVFFDLVGFRERLRRADLLMTGEGRLDATSSRGKAALAAARAAQDADVPAIALVGAVGEGWEAALRDHGGPLESAHVITPADMPAAEALRRGAELLEAAARGVVASRSAERR